MHYGLFPQRVSLHCHQGLGPFLLQCQPTQQRALESWLWAKLGMAGKGWVPSRQAGRQERR